MKEGLDIKKFKGKFSSIDRWKVKVLSKLLIYSVLYGLFSMNYIDLVVAGCGIRGYHLWLVVGYFVPFIPLLFLFDFDDWELVASLGLTASLMNDLFYYPIGILFFPTSIGSPLGASNLSEWYAFQLGFKGFAAAGWRFNAGFFTIPVTSFSMGMTIYLRIGAVIALIYRWSHRRARSFQDLVQETADDVLKRIFGEKSADTILRYVEKSGSLKGKKKGVESFSHGLRNILGSGPSLIVENQVFRSLYSRLERLLKGE